MVSFREAQIERLAASGWACCPSVAEHVAAVGLPAVDRGYLAGAFPSTRWVAAEAAVAALREHFAAARFAEETDYGVLLVPDPGRLDTRRAMPQHVRSDQRRGCPPRPDAPAPPPRSRPTR